MRLALKLENWHVGIVPGRLMPIYEDDVVRGEPGRALGGWEEIVTISPSASAAADLMSNP